MTRPRTLADLRSDILDDLWSEVNALGGTATDAESHGYVAAIERVLNLIEARGGRDPLGRSDASPTRSQRETGDLIAALMPIPANERSAA